MKVLHLLQSDHFSGAENVVCQIIQMFRNEPAIEMVYCSQDGQIRTALQERKITFIPLSDFTIKSVRQAIQSYQPDIIHAHDMRASLYATVACFGIPIISHIHNNSFDARKLSIKSVSFILAGLRARHIFWVSKSAYEGYLFKKLFLKKSTVLPNIIDVDALYKKMSLDRNTYSYDVVYVGRLTYPKNPERIVEVVSLVHQKDSSIKVAIVGQGDLESVTRELTQKLNLLDCIQFLGFLTNPLKIIYDAKLMLMTSRWEGTPMCALEALSLGVPIVSTPTDGLSELLTNGVNGYLSEDNETLANRIVEIIHNDSLRQSLSNNAATMMRAMMDIEQYQKTISNQYIQSALK